MATGGRSTCAPTHRTRKVSDLFPYFVCKFVFTRLLTTHLPHWPCRTSLFQKRQSLYQLLMLYLRRHLVYFASCNTVATVKIASAYLPPPSPPPQSVTPYPSLHYLTCHIATASPLTVMLLTFPTAAFQVWPHHLLVLVKSNLWPHAYNRRSPKSTMSVFNLT
jgi:hypothetical protein